jgi:hypothetical protein
MVLLSPVYGTPLVTTDPSDRLRVYTLVMTNTAIAVPGGTVVCSETD